MDAGTTTTRPVFLRRGLALASAVTLVATLSGAGQPGAGQSGAGQPTPAPSPTPTATATPVSTPTPAVGSAGAAATAAEVPSPAPTTPTPVTPSTPAPAPTTTPDQEDSGSPEDAQETTSPAPSAAPEAPGQGPTPTPTSAPTEKDGSVTVPRVWWDGKDPVVHPCAVPPRVGLVLDLTGKGPEDSAVRAGARAAVTALEPVPSARLGLYTAAGATGAVDGPTTSAVPVAGNAEQLRTRITELAPDAGTGGPLGPEAALDLVLVVTPAGASAAHGRPELPDEAALETAGTPVVGLAVGTDGAIRPSGHLTEIVEAFGCTPDISIDRTARVVATDAAGPDPVPLGDVLPDGAEVPAGTTVRWTYTVTNTGTARLSDIRLTDETGTELDCPSTRLAPEASMTCTDTGEVVPTNPGP
ncbi:DUF7507 domain-containing protein [Brevibacterium litoralis]|uniref:DUF7507 domain-containing protein n=1 Tax=Brevibacterium litoralis TaxID=3138935 RepID=UPI0032EB20ED